MLSLFSSMSFFSSQSDKKQKNTSQDIPTEIVSAVSIMGSPSVGTAPRVPQEANTPETLPVSRQESPFLSESFPSEEGSPVPPQNGSFQAKNPLISTEQQSFSGKTVSQDSETSHQKNRLLFVVLGGTLILTVAGLSLWYFMKPTPEESTLPVQAEIIITPVESSIVVSEPPFSLDTPNYLSFDTETVTPESFQSLIDQSAARILTAHMAQPVEFLLTDKKNNPIAFSRFAYLMKLGLPEDLIALFGEPFSLFLYNDAGRVARGLSLTLTPGGEAKKLVTQKEESLPSFFQTLLFREKTVPKEVVFRSGVYNTESVRFVNIDTTQNISFDYVLRDTTWIIGTSKETLRAILDKKGLK